MIIDTCLNLELRKSTRIVTHFYESRLAAVGLKSGQFSILRAVNFLKQTTNKELQRILVLEQTTLSRSLKPLIRDELLTIQANPDDQRVKLISLSKEGVKTYDKALPLWLKAQSEIKALIGQEEAEKIQSLSKKLSETLKIS
ncbi:MAG: MarR family winged helix-turn-helix transcriptional regulator [Kangiellaceae bacterium]|nr:MarR family winged helix-turn-helix transcriptional regulator [Kangiellaceae bacterium]